MSFENANFKPVEAVFRVMNPKLDMVRISARRLYLKKFLTQLGSPKFINFYIDKENKLLAVAPCDENDPNRVMIQRGEESYAFLPLEIVTSIRPNFNKRGYIWITPEFAKLNIDGEEGQYLVLNYSRGSMA